MTASYNEQAAVEHLRPFLAGETLLEIDSGISVPEKPSISLSAKFGPWITPVMLLIADYILIVFALHTAYYLRNWIMPISRGFRFSEASMYIVLPAIYISLLYYQKLYTKRLPLSKAIENLFKVCFFASIITVLFFFLNHTIMSVSRIYIVFSGMICFLALVIGRHFTKKLLVTLGFWQRPVVVIGSGKTAEQIAAAYESEPYLGYKIIGVIGDNRNSITSRRYPFLGNFKQIEEILQNSGVREVIIALPEIKRQKLIDLVYRIQPFINNVSIVPDIFGTPLNNIEVETLFKQKMVLLKMQNGLLNVWNCLFKRLFDLIAGVIAAILASPIMIVCAILIKIDSKGPVLHNAKRIGKNGREFTCYKFRTMHQCADDLLDRYFEENPLSKIEWERYAKLKNDDPRITRTGRWLRKFSLDELPQVFNVLKGEMSLVGPRPYLPREKEKMSFYFETIVETKPGITGLWQVSGRNDVEFNERLTLDSWYVRNWSFWLDVSMILKTINVVFGKKGAY